MFKYDKVSKHYLVGKVSNDIFRAVVVFVHRQSAVASAIDHQQRHSTGDEHIATNVKLAVV